MRQKGAFLHTHNSDVYAQQTRLKMKNEKRSVYEELLTARKQLVDINTKAV